MNDCNHEQTRIELLPANQEHYARVACTACGKTLCYQSHPHTLAKRQENAANIQKLLADKRLTAFERGFLMGLRNHKPTPNQQKMLDTLLSKYNLNQGSNSSEQIRETVLATMG